MNRGQDGDALYLRAGRPSAPAASVHHHAPTVVDVEADTPAIAPTPSRRTRSLSRLPALAGWLSRGNDTVPS